MKNCATHQLTSYSQSDADSAYYGSGRFGVSEYKTFLCSSFMGLFYITGKFGLLHKKALRAGLHCGGEEGCR